MDCFVRAGDRTMQRFFMTSPLDIDLEITDPDIHHQLTRVMRVKVGEHIVLFDGDGSETTYEISDISKKSISLRGKERRFPKTEYEKRITLCQAIPNKIEKIEYILEKWVEVGIHRFIFFRSDHSQKLVISEMKKKRFSAIAREALEQCGGLVMPEIEFVDQITDGGGLWRMMNLALDTTGTPTKIEQIAQNREISLWVGPEWGWSDRERIEMNKKGFIFVRFGERVLRTETAGVVVGFSLLNQ
jgi:16S rRNA (uracil1498-N3)-methyltransferase